MRSNIPITLVSEAVVAHEVANTNMESKNPTVTTTTTHPTSSDVEGAAAGQNDSKSPGVSVYPESHSEFRSSSEDDLDKVDPNFQHGVQMAQAITQVWTRNHLILAFAL